MAGIMQGVSGRGPRAARNALVALTGLLVALAGFTAPAQESGSAWRWSASAAVKEAYDSNIYLQSVTPLANRDSWVTTLLPSVGVAYGTGVFAGQFTYTPELNWFSEESSEDFILHRVGLGLSGRAGSTAWDLTNCFTAVDGSDVAPIYTGPGGSPATGGPAVRDRRDAMVERGQIRVTQTLGDWFVRPVMAGYLHDFQLQQRNVAGYQNYADRDDWNGGLDVGYQAAKDLWVVAGYRYGAQHQAAVFPEINPVHYDSTYHRALFGLEGKPWSWLKVAFSLGPEFREFGDGVAPGFDAVNETYLYADAAFTLTPTKLDTIVLTARRFEQPGASGRSVYVDGTYTLVYRHKFGTRWTVGCGGRGYNTDFLLPTVRNDWILSGNGFVSCRLDAHASVEVSYAYERGVSEVADMAGREYTRHLVSLGLSYSFN